MLLEKHLSDMVDELDIIVCIRLYPVKGRPLLLRALTHPQMDFVSFLGYELKDTIQHSLWFPIPPYDIRLCDIFYSLNASPRKC